VSDADSLHHDEARRIGKSEVLIGVLREQRERLLLIRCADTLNLDGKRMQLLQESIRRSMPESIQDQRVGFDADDVGDVQPRSRAAQRLRYFCCSAVVSVGRVEQSVPG
jgi:hypothetical protein